MGMITKIPCNDIQICKINNEFFPDRYKNSYLLNNFNITFENYLIKYYLNNIVPICKCGCGTQLKIKFYNNEISVSNFTKNHWPHEKHSDEVKQKIKINTKKSIMNKFGVDNVFKLYEIKEKSKKTKLERYGNDKYNNAKKNAATQLDKFYNKLFDSDRLHKEYTPLFLFNKYKGVIGNRKYKFKHNTCRYEFEYTLDNGKLPRCPNCYPFNAASKYEQEIYDFLRELLPNEIILRNDRNVLDKIYELDLYLPNKKFAIEHDGLYPHSELGGHKGKKYHLGKTKFCYLKDVRLIHIFEDEWRNKNNIVKRIIKNALNITDGSLYARNCIIKNILETEKNEFLNKYHIQGPDKSSIKLGAFYNNEMVAVMTFGINRIFMGSKGIDGNYELYRFATKCKITGVASKLLTHFIRNYNPNKIITYSDRRYFNGNTYEKIGFKFDGITQPNYWYMKKYDVREYRFNYMKSKLKTKLKIYDENLTEWENMQLNGYDRIWDCGSSKYEMIF